eukprot:CAMPEP_0174694054 /NCGR_PEP_ID=MMETSP1094-20130205/695_1 /TAXON_ID=156173 /ORGANISM="Chrysochromulina brevifilum, Strain UTEX LB 985" /LENGTH=418 /DNA_ID=CAMNT_0015890177 /DNA_START=35 /DNA_END=1291 /DNA_ORIENTATION=+
MSTLAEQQDRSWHHWRRRHHYMKHHHLWHNTTSHQQPWRQPWHDLWHEPWQSDWHEPWHEPWQSEWHEPRHEPWQSVQQHPSHHQWHPSLHSQWRSSSNPQSQAAPQFKTATLHEAVGSGHSCTVYRATNDAGEALAAKVVHDAGTLAHEVRVLERLAADSRAHLRVVAYRGIERGAHASALFMHFERGGTLQQVLSQAYPVGMQQAPPSAFLACIAELSDALDACHSCSVVHGDLGARNVLLHIGSEGDCQVEGERVAKIQKLSESGANAAEAAHAERILKKKARTSSCVFDPTCLILTDMGDAKLMDDLSTFTSTPPGAPSFHCPYDVNAGAFSDRSDTWGLAQMAVELWLGSQPCANPASLPDTMPLVSLLHRCHAALPAERPTCAEICIASEALLGHLGSSRAEEMRKLSKNIA